jgi:hypothetical protein
MNVNMIDTEKYQPTRQNMKFVTRSLRSLAKLHILARQADIFGIKSMGFTYPIPYRWRMCVISYSIPRWRTAISCGQCRSSNMIYYAEMHRQTVEKLT